MARATYKGKSYHRFDNGVDLFYEYRGHEYMITDNGWYGDHEPLWVKHKNEQARINEIIEWEQKPKKEYKYEDSAEYGFEVFWKEVEK